MFAYIIKSTICLVLLLAFYHFVLEKEKMHQFNRFYLLGSIVFSLIVPSFIITVAPAEFVEPILNQQENALQFQSEYATTEIIQKIDYTNYFIGLYCTISLILLFLLTKKIYQLLAQTKRNKKVSYFSATVVLLKEKIVPYTFLHYIFINKKKYKTNAVEQQILTHELTHVQQKHSLDVLFIEVLQNLFWFNPIFRYYKKAIQLNHEFLADDAVLKSHKNIAEYQYVLLNTTAQQNNIYLASNLNYSLTKKRLLMMTTPSSKTKILLKKLMVIPLTAGFIFAFAQRVEAQENNNDKPQIIETKEKLQDENELTIFIKKDGKLNIKNQVISYSKLSQVLNQEIKDINKAHIILKTDAKEPLKFSQLNKIKNVLRENGIYAISFQNFAISPKSKIIFSNSRRNSKKVKHQIIEVPEGISDKEMEEYKNLIATAKKLRTFKSKELKRMQFLYKKMSLKQQNSVEDIYKIAPPFPPISYKKKTPTEAQFNSWKNNQKFALWIDGKVVNNTVLNNYKNTDFPYYFNSFVYKNARSNRFPQEHQVNLYTHAAFKKMKAKEAQEDKNSIKILINKDGGLLVNNKVTSINKLKATLNKIDIDKDKAHIIITTDKRTTKEDLLKVKKILRENEFYKISINSKLLPPPPPMDIVFTYKKLAKRIQSTSKNRKTNVIYLNELYNKMTASQKKQVKKPSRVLPPPPPKTKTKEIAKKSKLIEFEHKTKEVADYIDGKRNLKKVEAQELKATEKLRIAHEKKHKSLNLKNNDSRAVVVSGGKMKMSLLETVKMWSKNGAGFVYNNKAITAKKGIEIVSKNKKIRVYSVEEERGKPILVYISDKK